MSENNTAIKLNNISKRFNVYSKNIERIKGALFGREPAEVKHALNNVSLEIKKGEHVVVCGVVDSGRSTLLKVIAGITSPSKGKVYVDGSVNVMLDSRVGIDMEFSCRENIYMKANVVGLSRAEIESHVDEIIEFAEIEKYVDIPMKRAPKGTAAQISTAVHLYKDADIILCDEVFGGGGNPVYTKCENRMLEYMDEKPHITVLMVSNRLAFVKNLGTRTIVLDKGKIVFDGDANEAISIFQELNKRI